MKANNIKERITKKVLFGSLNNIKVYEIQLNMYNDDTKTRVINIFDFEKDNIRIPVSSHRDIVGIDNIVSVNEYKTDEESASFNHTVSIRKVENKIDIKSKSCITKAKQNNSELTEICLNDSVIAKDRYYIINIIFTGSYCAPIIRIFRNKDNLPINNTKPSYGLVSLYTDSPEKSERLIYDSQSSVVDINKVVTTTTVTNQNKIPQADISFISDKIIQNSSLSKEEIEYDDNGEVIGYWNSKVGLKMYREDISNEEFPNSYSEIITLDGHIINKIDYLKNDFEEQIISLFDNKLIMRSIEKDSDGNLIPLEKSKRYEQYILDPCGAGSHQIITLNDSDNNIKDVDYLEFKILSNHARVSESTNDEDNTRIVKYNNTPFYDKYYSSDDKTVATESITYHMDRYDGETCIMSRKFGPYYEMDTCDIVYLNNTMKVSYDGIGAQCANNIRYTNKSGIFYSILRGEPGSLYYTDIDFSIKINNNKITDFKSEFLDKSDQIYIRDEFGIPRLLHNEE